MLALTGGRGVDHVLEVGGPASFAESLRAVAVGGQISVIGYLGGAQGAINPLDIFRRKITVRGIPVGSRETFETLVQAVEVNDIHPVLGRTLDWSELPSVLLDTHAVSHIGKVALHIAA